MVVTPFSMFMMQNSSCSKAYSKYILTRSVYVIEKIRCNKICEGVHIQSALRMFIESFIIDMNHLVLPFSDVFICNHFSSIYLGYTSTNILRQFFD